MANVVNSSEFKNSITNGVVVVDFFATWCGPCKMLAPIFEELSHELEGKAKLIKVDIDNSGDIAREYGIVSVPTIKIFKDGNDVETSVGFLPKEELMKKIEQYL